MSDQLNFDELLPTPQADRALAPIIEHLNERTTQLHFLATTGDPRLRLFFLGKALAYADTVEHLERTAGIPHQHTVYRINQIREDLYRAMGGSD
jgi:hypothetical protein